MLARLESQDFKALILYRRFHVMKFVRFARLLAVVTPLVTSSAHAAYLFTDGTGFGPTPARGGTAQPLAQFTMSNGETSAQYTFSGVTIRLDGTRTGLSNFNLRRIYQNQQRGSTVPTDPGEGNTVSFTFSEPIPGGFTYTYELTADVASDATGSVTPVLPSSASITATTGSGSGSLTNTALSSSAVPLPVTVSVFSAE
jgi:hypothetical protein